MEAPLTRQNYEAWDGMVNGGMKPQVAFERMTDWAAMLEDRVAELDPNYLVYRWGENVGPGIDKPKVLAQNFPVGSCARKKHNAHS